MQSTQSIDRAAWLNKFALIGYIGSLVVVAILTFLSWWAGSHLQNVIQKDADARIAEADSKAAAANENAGKANERAGVANERAQKLENDNVQLRTDLENATADAKSKIEGARAEANVKIEQARTEAARQVGEVQKDVEEQRERAAKAEKDLLEFKQRFRDRHLSDTDRKSITAMLRRGPKGAVQFLCDGNGPEPCNFAREIRAVFEAEGWQVEGDTIPTMFFQTHEGIQLAVHSAATAPPHLHAVFEALQPFSLLSMVNVVDGIPEGIVQIFVGRRPSPLVSN